MIFKEIMQVRVKNSIEKLHETYSRDKALINDNIEFIRDLMPPRYFNLLIDYYAPTELSIYLLKVDTVGRYSMKLKSRCPNTITVEKLENRSRIKDTELRFARYGRDLNTFEHIIPEMFQKAFKFIRKHIHLKYEGPIDGSKYRQ